MKAERIAMAWLATIVIAATIVRAEDPVPFVDPALKMVVEEQLGVSNPTPKAMLGLTTLNATNRKIASLVGLEYAKNLGSLLLEENQIVDLSPLAGLTNLKQIELTSNQVVDITPLALLVRLERLGLSGNKISSAKGLFALASLVSLDLSHNNLTTLEGLSALANLEGLDVRSNHITDISAAAGLAKVSGLNLAQNDINDIRPLAGLTSLTTLDLSENRLTDIRPLAGLINLMELGLENPVYETGPNQIRDIGPLTRLVKLTALRLRGNHVADTSALSGMTKLTSLDLRYNEISDISGLAGLRAVTYMDLSDNQIANVRPLKDLVTLDWLNLANNKIADITPLAGLTALKDLLIGKNQVTDISALASLKSLQWFSASFTPVADLGPLSKLTNLTTLEFYGSGSIYDISPLAGLTKLDYLDLQGNYVTDISPLTGLTNLHHLNLVYNPLNAKACSVYIPVIKLNNPGLKIYYDACTGRVHTLTISSTPGGSVTKPGEGPFICTEGEWVQIEAVAKQNYVFTRWSGTAVDAGKVAKPTSPSTTVVVNADCTLVANFKSTLPTPPSPPSPVIEDFERGILGAGWSSTGSSSWSVTSEERHSGQYSIRADPIDDNQTTTLTLRATVAAGQISFWRKVSSEAGSDIYRFSIDGNLRETLSGEYDWKKVSFPITAGSHTFTWEYRKDPSSSSGADTVYLDDVSIPAAP